MELVNFIVAFLAAFLISNFLITRIYGLRKGSEIPPANKEIKKALREKLFLIYFYTPNCPACRRMQPEIEKIGRKYRVVKVNAAEEPQVARALKVMAVPKLIVVKNGRVAETFTGIKKAEDVVKKISSL